MLAKEIANIKKANMTESNNLSLLCVSSDESERENLRRRNRIVRYA